MPLFCLQNFLKAQHVIEITDRWFFNLPKLNALQKYLGYCLLVLRPCFYLLKNIMLIIFKTQAPEIQLIIFSVMQA